MYNEEVNSSKDLKQFDCRRKNILDPNTLIVIWDVTSIIILGILTIIQNSK